MNICRPRIRKCELEEEIDFAEEWAVICSVHGIHTHHSTWNQAMWVAGLHIKRVNKRRLDKVVTHDQRSQLYSAATGTLPERYRVPKIYTIPTDEIARPIDWWNTDD